MVLLVQPAEYVKPQIIIQFLLHVLKRFTSEVTQLSLTFARSLARNLAGYFIIALITPDRRRRSRFPIEPRAAAAAAALPPY